MDAENTKLYIFLLMLKTNRYHNDKKKRKTTKSRTSTQYNIENSRLPQIKM